ncbi:MAG: tetratricopeptide repeat protein [Candidatus Edwardsbacteria bacterium]
MAIQSIFLLSREQILQRAKKLRAEGKNSKAIDFLRSGIKGEPEDFDLYLELASCQLQEGENKEATLSLKNALSLKPQRDEEVIRLAEGSFWEKKSLELGEFLFELAVGRRDFEGAVKIVSSFSGKELPPLYNRYLKLVENIEKFRGPGKEEPITPRDILVYYCLGLIYEAKEQFPELAKIFNRILEVAPSETETILKEYERIAKEKHGEAHPYLARGDIYAKLSQPEKAVEEWREATKTDANSIPAAIERLVKFLPQNPQIAPGWEILGDLFTVKKRFSEAVTAYDKVREADPEKSESLLPKYREVIRLDPKNLAGYLSLGDTASNIHKYDLALASYSKITEIDPTKQEEVLNRSLKILKEEPTNASCLHLVTDSYLALNRLDSAIETLSLAYKKDPELFELVAERLNLILEKDINHQTALALLAEIYFKKKDIKGALVILRHLLSLKDGPELVIPQLQKALTDFPLERDDPRLLTLQLTLTEALVAKKDFKGALFNIGKILSKDKSKAENFLPLLDHLAKSDEENIKPVFELYRLLEQQGVKSLSLNWALAENHLLLKNYPEAMKKFNVIINSDETLRPKVITAYQRTLEKDPQATPVRLALIDLYYQEQRQEDLLAELQTIVSTEPARFGEISAWYERLLKTDERNLPLRKSYIDLLVKAKLYQKAITEAEKAISVWPDREGAYFLLKLSEALIFKGEFSKAVGHLLKAVTLDGSLAEESLSSFKKILSVEEENIPAHYGLAKVHQLMKDFSSAIEELSLIIRHDPKRTEQVLKEVENIVEQDPICAKAHQLLGELLIQKGEEERGMTELERGMELDRSLVDNILGKYQLLLEKKPKEPDKIRFALARAYIAKGLYTASVKEIEKVLESDFGHYHEFALLELKRIVELQPQEIKARYLLTKIYQKKKVTDSAVTLLREIISFASEEIDEVLTRLKELETEDPENAVTHYALGDVYLEQGEAEKAVEHYNRVLFLYPEELEKVIGKLQGVIQKQIESAPAYLALGKALIKRGLLTKATESLNKARQIDASLKNPVKEGLEEILSLEANLLQAAENLGLIYFEGGEYSKAKDLLIKALKAQLDKERTIELNLYLSQTLTNLGKMEEAKQVLLKLQELDPENQQLYKIMKRFEIKSLKSIVDEAKRRVESAPDDQEGKIFLASLYSEKMKRGDWAISLLQFTPLNERISLLRTKELGKAFLTMGDLMSAVEVMRNVPLARHPLSEEEMELAYTLGEAYEKMGNYPAAIAAYKKIYLDDINYRDIKMRLDKNYTQLLLQDLERKKKVIEKMG